MDAGLMDDAAAAKGRLVNEIQRGDMARGGPAVSPDANARGDERVFKGAKVAIERGMLTTADLEMIKPHLSRTQIGELEQMIESKEAASMVPGAPLPVQNPDISSALNGIEVLPEFTPADKWVGPARIWEPEPKGEPYFPPSWRDYFSGDGSPTDFGVGGPTGPAAPWGAPTGPAEPWGEPTTGGSVFPGQWGDDLPPEDVVGPPAPPAPAEAGLSFGLPGVGQTSGADLSFGLPGATIPGRGAPAGAPPQAAPATPAEDPIIELAGSASSKGEALAIADEAEASGLFPGARAKVLKYFGWDEDKADDMGDALMGFGIGLLQGGPDFGSALGNAFAKGAQGFDQSQEQRRQAALDDRRIAMEDERLDFAREEMNQKRKQAALERLEGEAAATQSGLIYYEDGEGRIRSRPAPLASGPQDEDSKIDMDRIAYIEAMPDGPMKDALRERWFPTKKEADPLAGIGGV